MTYTCSTILTFVIRYVDNSTHFSQLLDEFNEVVCRTDVNECLSTVENQAKVMLCTPHVGHSRSNFRLHFIYTEIK